jgi:hypothetical protein
MIIRKLEIYINLKEERYLLKIKINHDKVLLFIYVIK